MMDEPRPGTVGALDRRVERLESQVGDLSTEFKLMKAEQNHTRELMEQHFKTIEGSVALSLSEIKLLGSRFDAAVLQSTAMLGDPSSTPAGRQIVERLTKMEADKLEEHAAIDARVSGLERKLWTAAGATALAVLIITLLGPLLLRLVVP